jgi:hypothetical protein
MTGNELSAARLAIVRRLSTEPTGEAAEILAAYATLAAYISTSGAFRIYFRRAPQAETRPYVLAQFIAGEDLMGVGKKRFIARPLWSVRLTETIAGAVSAEFMAAADALDALLHSARLVSYAQAPGYSFNIWREQPAEFSLPQPADDAKTIYQLGGYYRVETLLSN